MCIQVMNARSTFYRRTDSCNKVPEQRHSIFELLMDKPILQKDYLGYLKLHLFILINM